MSTLADRDRPVLDAAPPQSTPPITLVPSPIVLPERRSARAVVASYVALTKPRIVELLLVTTVPTMLLAARGLPSLLTVLVTVVGGALAAGSANALNCYIDRDIDQVMGRTSRRPLPTHVVQPRSALAFGLVLAAASLVLMAGFTNPLATVLTGGSIFYYVVIYTMLLKRRTVHNTVLGGVCGAAPVLIGWAAVTGTIGAEAWVLFAVMFFWQPPHFWALAIKFKDDYARAGIPMLPVVASMRRVAVESIVYTWLTVVASLGLAALGASLLYTAAAAILGLLFLLEAYRLHGRVKRGEPVRPMRLFHWSITYVTLLFLAVAVDAFLR